MGDVRLFGGYSNGAIDNTHVGYDGFQAVVGVFQSDEASIDLYKQEGIAFSEYETGKGLAQKIKADPLDQDSNLLIFFDAVNRQKGRFQMNYGAPFMQGIKEEWAFWPNIAGARLLGDMRFKPTYQWFGDELLQNAAMALAFRGNIQMEVKVLHGCTPASAYHTVTRTEGASVVEIDGEPALDFVGNIFGPELAEDYRKLKFFVTMGKNLGDKWALNSYTDYVNRMCVGIDEKRRGLRMAEVDLVEGTEFQLMRRGFEMDYVVDEVRATIENVKQSGRRPIFALYLNCAGRAASYSQNTEEDAHYLQRAIQNEFPVLGIYEAGEFAKVGGEFQVLDWTGVFCLFSEKIN